MAENDKVRKAGAGGRDGAQGLELDQWLELVEAVLDRRRVLENLAPMRRLFLDGRPAEWGIVWILGRTLTPAEAGALEAKWTELEARDPVDPGRLGRCPFCGSAAGVTVRVRARGAGSNVFSNDGRFVETVEDRVWFEPVSEAVRCLECTRIRRDLIRDNTEIVSVEAG